jgi:hypothetical protein
VPESEVVTFLELLGVSNEFTIVVEAIQKADGSPRVGAYVSFEPVPSQVYDVSTGIVVNAKVRAKTDENGMVQVALYPNNVLSPVGSVYRVVTATDPDTAVEQFIVVPDTGGPYLVEALLTTQPGDLPEPALVAHEGETIAEGAHGGP